MENAIDKTFHQLVKDWWRILEGKLTRSASQGRRVVLIALSRKMPRFFNWFIDNLNQFSQDTDIIDLLKRNVELSTELSIPYLLLEETLEEIDFIILDDAIIHGSSLKCVADELYFLTRRMPQMSCIVKLDKATCPDNIPFLDFDRINTVTEDEANEFSDCISRIVTESQLPIDMEFPVFSINAPQKTVGAIADEIKNFLNNGEHDEYIGSPYDVGNNNFAVNLKHYANVGLNVDFAKVRFFQKGTKMIVEVINPMIFSQDDICSTTQEIFPNGYYQAIWERSTRKIRVILREGVYNSVPIPTSVSEQLIRSLVVWINYLYSISSVAKNLDSIIPVDLQKDMILRKSDLALIVGRYMARFLHPLLMTIIVTRDSCRSSKDRVTDATSWFAPDAFSTNIQVIRTMSAIEKDTVEEVFEDIFRFQHYGNPKFKNSLVIFERLFFGETFESLLNSIHPFFDKEESRQPLMAWIDEKIDKGYVVPKYERKRDKSGNVYWRRYFHSGIRKQP